ncbi:Rft protein-domain-containing protein [Schizophyllum commune]
MADSPSPLSTTSHLVFLQLFTRLLTFAMNRTLLRLASTAAYGTASIQFELLISTILFLAREGVRGALLRSNTESETTSKEKTISDSAVPSRPPLISYLPLAWGIPLAVGTAAFYALSWAGPETRAQPFFQEAVAIYALAALIELAAEPMHNATMVSLRTQVRVRAEGLAIAFKTMATLAVLLYGERVTGDGQLALLAFAAGQLTYASTLVGVYAAHYSISWLVPDFRCVQFLFVNSTLSNCESSQLRQTSSANTSQTRLALAMTGQSLVKHVLTECDKLILAWVAPLTDQGGYAVAVNYGSLLARIILQPIEETLRVHFSRAKAEAGDDQGASEDRTTSSAEVATSSTDRARRTLLDVLAVQLGLSLIFLTFAVPYLPVLLPFVLTPKWMATSAPRILQAWMWYVPVLAVNGSMEAYVSSLSSESALGAWSRYLTLASPIFPATALGLYRAGFGDEALVYANIANLAARIAYCVRFAFPAGTASLRDVLPGRIAVIACAVANMAIRASTSYVLGNAAYPWLLRVAAHVAIGGCLGVACVVAWWAGDNMPQRLGLDGWMGLGVIESRLRRLAKAQAKEE